MYSILFASVFFLQTAAPSAEKAEQKKAHAVAEMMEGTRSIMIIDPKERATDFMKAYEFLVQEKSSSKVYFDIRNGMKIYNVIDMKLMPGNTLVIFRYNTPQGVKYQVVEIQDILGVYHQ